MARKFTGSVAEMAKNVTSASPSENIVALLGPCELDASVAEALDAEINAKIAECSEQLARVYLELGRSLVLMRDSKGFKALGFPKWENYLDSKRDFGRTYLSYLYKLGKAGELEQYLDQGMSATKLIEFAKKTTPEKVGILIEATWEEVKERSVKDTDKFLSEWVAKHQKEFGRAKTGSKAGRKKLTLVQRFDSQYKKLSTKDRKDYLAQMVQFLTTQGFNVAESES
jgi:hypothetical protein